MATDSDVQTPPATGMRRGQVLTVRGQDVNHDDAPLTVSQSLEEAKAGLRFKPSKNRLSRRQIALSPLTVDILRRHKIHQSEERLMMGLGRNEDGLVFADVEGRLRERRPRLNREHPGSIGHVIPGMQEAASLKVDAAWGNALRE